MIFAELRYKKHYSDLHEELLTVLKQHFTYVQAGLQGDSWLWILDGDEKVALDTFTAMKHQVKSRRPGAHVKRVLDVLLEEYRIKIYEKPEFEPHEGG